MRSSATRRRFSRTSRSSGSLLSGSLALLAFAAVSPDHSATALERLFAWLRSHDRVITIVLGIAFGTWFLVMALSSLGIL